MTSYKIGTPVYYNYSNNNHTTQWRMIWHIYHHWYSNGCLFYKTTYEHTYAYMIYGTEMKRVWFSQYTVVLVSYICVKLLKLVCVQNNKITLRYIKFTDQTAICTRIDKQKRSTTRKHLVYLWQRNNSMMTCYTSFDIPVYYPRIINGILLTNYRSVTWCLWAYDKPEKKHSEMSTLEKWWQVNQYLKH